MDVLVSAEGFKVLSWFIIFAGIFIVVVSQILVKYVKDKFSKNALSKFFFKIDIILYIKKTSILAIYIKNYVV